MTSQPNRRKNNKIFSASVIIGIIVLSIAVSGIIWRGSETASKATIAYAFSEENKFLPQKVLQIERQVEKFDRAADKLIEVTTVQQGIKEALEMIVKKLDRLSEKQKLGNSMP
ncbi:MAG: hypothetical protein KKD18_01020 [Nanoarchaeota archaeon]|nr:hypothetical protein [Nanoarchaeota archaeon]